MQIIHIVDNISSVNMGVWKAATNTSRQLYELYDVKSEIWFPPTQNDDLHKTEIYCQQHVLKDTSIKALHGLLQTKTHDVSNTIILTHGCWQFPTRWGFFLKKSGFKWIYVPHGMLEPWSLQQKALIKTIYFNCMEKRWAKKADIVRAVGKPESINLQKQFPRVRLIPNGIEITQDINTAKNTNPTLFIFLSRLHYKKGVLQLVKGWLNSSISKDKHFKLIIAGPDEGELPKILPLINNCENCRYIGAVYGKEKEKLMNESSFFILPSYSEGFPVSILEAMSYSVIPVISEGCNFSELFEIDLAYKTGTSASEIMNTLNHIQTVSESDNSIKARKCRKYVERSYPVKEIARQQYLLYSKLLKNKMP